MEKSILGLLLLVWAAHSCEGRGDRVASLWLWGEDGEGEKLSLHPRILGNWSL